MWAALSAARIWYKGRKDRPGLTALRKGLRMQQLKRTKIAENIYFSYLRDSVFKTARISAAFLFSPRADTVCANAVLPFLIARGGDLTEVKRELESLYGAQLSADVSKTGLYQTASVEIETVRPRFASGGADPAVKAAGMLASLITRPLERGFAGADVEAEKNNVIGLIMAEENDKQTYASDRCDRIIFGEHPFSLGRYGDRAGVAALSAADLESALRRALSRARIEITVIGDGDERELRGVFEEAFSKTAREPEPAPEPDAIRRGELRRVTERLDVTQAKLVVAMRTPARLPADCSAMTLMNWMYGVWPGSKLFRNVRERLSLCYYCSARYNRSMGLVKVSSAVLEEKAAQAEKEIEAQLGAMKSGDFTDEDIAQAKLSLANNYAGVRASLSSLMRYTLSEAAAGTFLSPEEAARAAEAVGREQIIGAARTCLPDTVYLLAPRPED